MKNAWIIIAVIILFQPIMPVLEYFIDYDYISTVLCINKEDSSLQCNGKCQLGKELAKDSNPKQNQDSSQKKLEILPLFYNQTQPEINVISIANQITNFDYKNTLKHNPHTIKLIQPPIV